ncbi:MAG: sigma-70 family RNA polymerase sigma factor [Deltaproteobacteria bacterium]|nr:sigma-70 family RNA polymerase sigma factor [Deltaproteobacteria bacterium]
MLFEAWRRGDSAAGEALFERYYSVIERFFYNKAPDVTEREDLMHTTILGFLESAGNFRGSSSSRTFLLGIATNVWRTRCRHAAGPRQHVELSTTSLPDAAESPSEVTASFEEGTVLLTALRRVPNEAQLLLELRYWEPLTLREISEVLDISLSTVKNRLRQAKEDLKNAIDAIGASQGRTELSVKNFDEWAARIRG